MSEFQSVFDYRNRRPALLSGGRCLIPPVAARLLLTAKANVSRAALLGLTVAEWRAQTHDVRDGVDRVCELGMRGATARALASSSRGATSVHRAADAHLKPFSLVVRAAFNLGRKALGTPPNADRAAAAVKSALLKALPPALAACYAAGGRAGLESLSRLKKSTPRGAGAVLRGAGDVPGQLRTLKPQKTATIGIRFDAKDEKAIAWAKERTAELAKGISETSRDRIKSAIARSFEGGIDFEDARDEILDAVGNESRADLIARNENMIAAHEGQRAGWNEAVEMGLLPEDAERVWITTPGCCKEICEGLEGKTSPLNGVYTGDDGEEYDGPPAHVSCRCGEGVR